MNDADLFRLGDLRAYAGLSIGIPMHVRHLRDS